ncbi:hypothetical protein GCK32_003535 [Trichostrongylus colubriformis]|uniref:Uncharacterized protein n=1 Tax=Trichostrongylus colubriformis TaxID=6319 RepID=A0AAN8IZG2_TRICO
MFSLQYLTALYLKHCRTAENKEHLETINGPKNASADAETISFVYVNSLTLPRCIFSEGHFPKRCAMSVC